MRGSVGVVRGVWGDMTGEGECGGDMAGEGSVGET